MASRKRESAGETASWLAGVRANANAGLIIQAGMDARFANSEPMVNYRVESSETDRNLVSSPSLCPRFVRVERFSFLQKENFSFCRSFSRFSYFDDPVSTWKEILFGYLVKRFQDTVKRT